MNKLIQSIYKVTSTTTITAATTLNKNLIFKSYNNNYYSTFASRFANKKTSSNRSSKTKIQLKPSYVKFTSEELIEKKKKQPGYKKNKTFTELLQENINDIQDLNIVSEASLHKGPLPINDVVRNTRESSLNEPIFTDENSSRQEIELEEQIRKLMIQQGKSNVSEVKIPLELVENSLGLNKELSENDIRFADMFFSKGCSLDSMAIKNVDFPKKTYPQVAFLGKSNVGKSTLLNKILHRDIAYVSKKPGCTKTINFYHIWEKIYLVDLPGYGFAKVSKKKSTVWGNSISEYLLTSPNLFKVFLLMDSRNGIHKNDIEAIKLLDSHKVAFQIVLTKIDKTNPSTLRSIYNTLKEEIQNSSCCLPTILQTSSIDNKGIDEIRSTILNVTGMDRETFEKRRSTPNSIVNSPPKIKTHSKQQLIQIDKSKKKLKNNNNNTNNKNK